MAHYDYRCDTCEAVFEECRPMAAADAPARCPDGHVGATRLLPFSPWADARICVLRGLWRAGRRRLRGACACAG